MVREVGSSVSANRETFPLKTSPPQGVERDLGGVADVGERHVAVGDLGDDADLVGPGDGQQGRDAPFGGRSDEGAAEETCAW